MAEPFLGEVRMFSSVFAPRGWALCDGQLLPINQNQALFSLLGTTFGGNGTTNFALPDLRGRAPVFGGGPGGQITLGQRGGEQAHTLTVAEMAQHNHPIRGNSANANVGAPAGNTWATLSTNAYGTAATGSMNATAIGNAGGSQPHLNIQPFLVINFCIALQGIFPSQT